MEHIVMQLKKGYSLLFNNPLHLLDFINVIAWEVQSTTDVSTDRLGLAEQ